MENKRFELKPKPISRKSAQSKWRREGENLVPWKPKGPSDASANQPTYADEILNSDPSAAGDSVLGDAGPAGAMANGKFAETKSSRSEKGGEVAVHPFEGNEETNIVAADNFERAASVVGAVHEKGATDGVGDFGGDFFLPGIHARGADAAGEVGTVRAEKFEEGGEISWIVLPIAVHHGGVGSGGGE